MKLIFAFSVLLCAAASPAFDIVLRNQDGSPYDAKGKVSMSVERKSDFGGIETIRCRVVSLCDEVQMLRISAEDTYRNAKCVWDGKDEIKPPVKRMSVPLYMAYRFLMIASLDGQGGSALAAGAEDFNSYVDGIFDGDSRAISVHASLLRKGAEYECSFHRIPFCAKYGIRDAYARYYRLYPRRFFKDSRVFPGYYGICAEYASWQSPDPDQCRFMNAGWDWCYGSDRSWGDCLNLVNPTGKKTTDYMWVDPKYCDRNGRKHQMDSRKLTREEFDEIQRERYSNGYYCGVANGFYTMALANISKKYAEPHPDSHATENGFGMNDYHYTTEVFAFPECSWGVELRSQLAKLMKKCDLGGMAFDVSSPRSVYRGERLKAMKNVSWDQFGPGVVRGVANAKIFDYVRTLKNSRLPGNAGVAVNTRYQHLSDMLYIDTTLHETTPWENQHPFPLHSRLALGEKGLSLWEGYSLKTFDPNYLKWPEKDRAMLINDLGRFAVHRSLATGASLPLYFASEYVARISHAFVRLNEAGWKPVIGATTADGEWELSRYGLGENSFIVACNLTNEIRKARIDVYPEEIATGFVGGYSNAKGYLYVPFYGGVAENRFANGNVARMNVSAEVGALLVNVLEAVATVDGAGSISASWEGDGFGRMTLKLVSRGFNGKVSCRSAVEGYRAVDNCTISFNGGETVLVRYCDEALAKAADAIAALDLSDLKGLSVAHATDVDSKEIAERFAYFFKSVTKPKDGKKAARYRSPVKVVEDGSLNPLSIRLGALELSAVDRITFSVFARRVLNVLNEMRYPEYGPRPKMDPWDAKYFIFMRY